MITLIRMDEDDFLVVDVHEGVFSRGSQDHAVEVLRDLYIDDEEIELALTELEEKGDNRAYFGGAGKLTYTENTLEAA